MRNSWGNQIFLVGIFALLLFSGCKMAWRALRYNKPSVTDFKYWEERKVPKSGETYGFVDGRKDGIPNVREWGLERWYKEGMTAEDYLDATGTVAFVVLRGDTLLYEHYKQPFADTSRFNVFSMTKVYVSVLTGIAQAEGAIKSIDQSIGEYLPWCTDSAICKVSIRNLLQMNSGIRSSEGYLNPWATTTKLYYGDQMDKIVHQLEIERPPNTKFFYQNINLQLLGLVLRYATGKSVGEYLSEKIWQPMGMEADAGWSLSEGTDIEKTFCCLNARARDYARFGLLVLNQGNWKGQQLIPKDWLKQSTMLDTAGASAQRYQFAWYLTAEEEDFWAEGLLGQFTYICPSTGTVIVRIGNSLKYNVPWYDSFKILAGLREKPQPIPFSKKDLLPMAGKYVFGPSNFGDTSLVGKVATIKATRKGLKIKTKFNKTWTAKPQSDSVFYYLSSGRTLSFHQNENGLVNGVKWYRRGNSWELKKTK